MISPAYGVVTLDFLITGDEHPCPYLFWQTSQEEFFFTGSLDPEFYHDLMDHGFRRSGNCFYRPICPDCSECRPIRVPTKQFEPSKSQRRILRKNEDAEIRVARPKINREKVKVYRDYLLFQHGSSNANDPTNLHSFLYSSSVMTLEFEYRLRGHLIAVGIVDVSTRSVSSVYAYFDPELASRSLGTFSALQEMLFCQIHGIPYYYLGFFVAACPAMSYKARFKPHELLDRQLHWVPK